MSESNNVEVYGAGAITSGDLTPEEIALVEASQNSGVLVKDGDERIDIDIAEEGEEGGEGASEESAGDSDKAHEESQTSPEDADLAKKVTESAEALETISTDLTAKGVDVPAIMAEFEKDGGLSAESYDALAKAGMSRVVVDSIIAGQVAVANSFVNAILSHAGGEQGLEALAQFALQNDPATIAAYNAALDRKDLSTTKAILNSWKAQRSLKLGTSNRQITGKPAQKASTVSGYTNKQEMIAAMTDSRYGKDTAYTREVERKVGASAWF